MVRVLALTAGHTVPFLTTWLSAESLQGSGPKAPWNIWPHVAAVKFRFKPVCKCVKELEGNWCVKMEGVRSNLENGWKSIKLCKVKHGTQMNLSVFSLF